MGFLDNDDIETSGVSDKLDLVEFESVLLKKFNDESILNTKYKAEEFGIFFDKKTKKSDVYKYENGEKIIICPEPLEFLREFDDVSDNTSKAEELFLKKIQSFKEIVLDKTPLLKGTSTYADRMWMNKTLTGINLRPGNLNDDRDNFSPIRMCDDNVHGLIVGRTGSGKSVFINALILSLITEYPPWELNLYLADFKKVELSRYMNNADEENRHMAFTPHVNACAATSEIRYVISLIKYIVECMNARQELFARLGVTKIQEFRTKYNLVLPRVLLIVDEFQQLFTEATNREQDEIQTMLNSITKLGRATGFHLIFASQEMSGTLRGNTLANFKIRMALPCNQQISTDILGNSRAVNLERGYVLVNTDSGDELKNMKYRVPFIETDKKDDDEEERKTPFYSFLDEIKLASKFFDLSFKMLSQKFYREELQETENAYKADLDRICQAKNELVRKSNSLFDAVVLGKSVLYSPKPNDKVSFYIEKGRNKGIMIACPDADNAARVRKLLSENLFRSDVETYHYAMEMNNQVLEKYRIKESIKAFPKHKYFSCEIDKALEILQMIYYLRQSASKEMEISQEEMFYVAKYEYELLTLLNNTEKVSEYEELKNKKIVLSQEIKKIEEELDILNKESKKKIENPVIRYLKKCSKDLILIPADKTKVDFVNLTLYKDIISNYTSDLDVCGATKKNIKLLDKQIEILSAKKVKSEADKQQNILAIQRNKFMRRALLFYVDKFQNIIPEKTSLSQFLDEIYMEIQPAVIVYKSECDEKRNSVDSISNLLEKKKLKQDELATLSLIPDEIGLLKENLLDLINGFLDRIFDVAYLSLGYKKNRPLTPKAEYLYVDGKLEWKVLSDEIRPEIKIVANDILKTYIEVSRGERKTNNLFKKIVFWINGLDEIEKIPNQLVESIRNAINQNILVVAIITSELKDTTIRKAFDYAFITGNIEKFYSMFNIKYTRQPLDSIVVNFGIRSKGFDIPFKMYKSNLEDIQAPNFLEQLLNS